MNKPHRFILPLIGAMAGFGALVAPAAATASSLQVIYQIDNAGDHLIGTFANTDGSVFVVSDVGQNGRGQILLLTPNKKKYTTSIIKEFACDTDGSQPAASLTADTAGNVWGMTNTGCGTGNLDGTLFELVKPAKGKKWTFRTVLQMPSSIGFEGVVGSGYGKMAFDDVGNLYGLETLGCNDGSCGKIYEVPVKVLGGKPKGQVKILYSFPQVNGGQPTGLVRDKTGNFFGITNPAGANNLGSAWEVSPPKKKNGTWTERTIYDFCSDQSFDDCNDGQNPSGLPTLDANGVLYGTTFGGGPNFAFGTVWSLTPSSDGKTWSFRQLHSFNDPVGTCEATTDYGVHNPFAATVFNQDGQLLTFTQGGGYFAPCTNSQKAIFGALMSIDPASGADAVANNQFAVQQNVSGPYNPASNPSVLGDTVFGTSSEYYDASSDTYSGGVVYKITP
ncbi:MAG: choice-of-anchor tandem repeat GloVer-containing protein [Rhizomicrobium sp.]